MALLIDLAATHATGRTTRSRTACRCTACRSSRRGHAADSPAWRLHVETCQTWLVALVFTPVASPLRTQVSQYMLQSAAQLNVATPSRGLMLACSRQCVVAWSLLGVVLPDATLPSPSTPLPLATRATRLVLGSLPSPLTPALILPRTCLPRCWARGPTNLDALGCTSKGKNRLRNCPICDRLRALLAWACVLASAMRMASTSQPFQTASEGLRAAQRPAPRLAPC